MAVFGSVKNLGRVRAPGQEAKVEFVELFFDLVFVFAVTQISHTLLEHLSLLGAVQAGFILMAVWWVWIYTSWVTNWMDPRFTAVRVLLFVLMFAGLVLSTSIPEAFGERGLLFACAYVVMQVGRSLFMMWALRRHNHANYLNFLRIFCWLALSGVFWIAGGLAEGEMRFLFWVIALGIEYVSPVLTFWTPVLGASTTSDWDIDGGHLAERSGLFIIIALGESVLVIGATFAGMEPNAANVAAFVSSFLSTIAMWWVYFAFGAEGGRHHIEHARDPGAIARLAYTYIHVVLVAGIIVTAVGDELILAHPTGHHADLATILTAVGGPALYLFGNLLFKGVTAGRPPLSHIAGLAALLVLALCGALLQPLALGIVATVVLVAVALWEHLSLRPQRAG